MDDEAGKPGPETNLHLKLFVGPFWQVGIDRELACQSEQHRLNCVPIFGPMA